MKRFAVIGSGGGSLIYDVAAVVSMHRDCNLVLALSNKPGAGILLKAVKLGLTAVSVPMIKNEEREAYDSRLCKYLAEYKITHVVLLGYKRILSTSILRFYPKHIINLHPALLPAFRGFDPQQQALDAGAKVTGCTVHFVDEGVDTGPIISQRALPIPENCSLTELCTLLRPLEQDALREAITLICLDKI